MKRTLLIILAAMLPSCESVPVAASYTGAAAGHNFTAAYSSTGGAALVVKQK